MVSDDELLKGMHNQGIYCKEDLIFELLLNLQGYNISNHMDIDVAEWESQIRKSYKLLPSKEAHKINDENNPIFKVLTENHGVYDTRIIFFDESELIIDKNQIVCVDGVFLFLCDTVKDSSMVKQGFSINTIDKVETIK